MPADGGEAIADLAVLRDQTALFGTVASNPTAWRLLSRPNETLRAELRATRARAREVAWAQHAEAAAHERWSVLIGDVTGGRG